MSIIPFLEQTERPIYIPWIRGCRPLPWMALKGSLFHVWRRTDNGQRKSNKGIDTCQNNYANDTKQAHRRRFQ